LCWPSGSCSEPARKAAFGADGRALPVQVVAVGNLPAQLDAVARHGLRFGHEGLVHRQQVGFVEGGGRQRGKGQRQRDKAQQEG
jgi:hypothetical protein